MTSPLETTRTGVTEATHGEQARAVQVLLVLQVLAWSVMGASCAHTAAEPPFTLKPLGSNVWAAIDNPKAKAPGYSNAGFVIGTDGVAVIDTFASADAAKQLRAEIRKLTKLPIKFVINTHYHSDHVTGNGVFVQTGAVVFGHRNVRDWIHAENLRLLTEGAAAAHETVSPQLRATIEGLVPPAVVYDTGVDLYLGARRLQVRSFPGHTGGDSVVLLPDAKIAFAGDLFWRNTAPNTVDASTNPWTETLNTLTKDHAEYTFVPGHGDVGTAQDVVAFRQYLETLRQLVGAAQTEGKSHSAVVETVMGPLKAQYGRWDYFDIEAPANIREMEAELTGKKRVPVPLAVQ